MEEQPHVITEEGHGKVEFMTEMGMLLCQQEIALFFGLMFTTVSLVAVQNRNPQCLAAEAKKELLSMFEDIYDTVVLDSTEGTKQ